MRGIAHHNSIEKTTEAELDALYNVHFKGVFFLTQKLLPLINTEGESSMCQGQERLRTRKILSPHHCAAPSATN